ncbi:MAG: hypothetical protein JSV04_13860 [Candidatus Heimdallarchaeota archaeon]|nr:MAG: hypothetical protein JSV04_13860 [Candidatus Heimdallarchaeota archaeon]
MKNPQCWSVLASRYRNPLLICSIDVYSHLTTEWHKLESVIIDTGYDGDLLLASDKYMELGFNQFELPSSSFDIAESIDKSDIVLRASISKAQWGEGRYEIKIESIPENQETILGRGLFLKTTNCFYNEKQEFCLLND